MGWLLRAFSGGVIKWVGFQIATLIGPLLIGIMTTTVGIVDGTATWMWAACAGSLAFGGSAAGAYYVISIAEKFRVKGRLSFAKPIISHDIESGNISLGFEVQNQADVLLEYEIKEIRTQLGKLFPPKKKFEKTIYDIPSMGVGWFYDYAIESSKPNGQARIEQGTIEVDLLYGKPGARKHKLSGKWITYLKYGSGSTIENVAWEVAN